MDKQQLEKLKVDQFVMYVGENDWAWQIYNGDVFKIVATGGIGFRMQREGIKDGGGSITVTMKSPTDARNAKFYKALPSFHGIQSNDETELPLADYELLIDYALEINDFDWVRELHAARQKIAI